MRIIVEQTGGFVGYMRHEIDSRDLSEEQREQLMHLLSRCRSREAARPQDQSPGNAPASQIIIETDGGSNTIDLGTPPQSKEAASLLKFVRTLGKPKPLL